jgi:hypothetical protein
MLQTLRGFALPENFIRDIHAMLQALFQENVDGEAAAGDTDPDILGAGYEE